MTIDFNINDDVKFKLTPLGRQILARTSKLCEEDAEGYVTWQLWDLMHTFGSYLFLGCDLPLHPDIVLINNDIIERDEERDEIDSVEREIKADAHSSDLVLCAIASAVAQGLIDAIASTRYDEFPARLQQAYGTVSVENLLDAINQVKKGSATEKS